MDSTVVYPVYVCLCVRVCVRACVAECLEREGVAVPCVGVKGVV
jgi:hypothetical protein